MQETTPSPAQKEKTWGHLWPHIGTILKLVLVLAILITVGVFFSQIKGCFTDSVTQVEQAEYRIDTIKMTGIKQWNTATINTNLDIDYGFNPRIDIDWLGIHKTLGDWAPGSRHVKANGPITYFVGYDSTFFDEKTLIVSTKTFRDTITIEVSESFPEPKLNSFEYRGLTKEDKSFFQQDISPDSFWAYHDTLARAMCNHIIQTNTEFFVDAYSKNLLAFVGPYEKAKNPGKVVVINLLMNNQPTNQLKPGPLIVPTDGVRGKRIIGQ